MANISVPKLANQWGVSRSHLYNLVKRKNDPLPVKRIGARMVVDEAEACMWRERETRAAKAA